MNAKLEVMNAMYYTYESEQKGWTQSIENER